MFGLGFSEVLIIMLVALIVFGPKKLPEVARTLGRTVGNLRRAMDDLREEIMEPTSGAKQNLKLNQETDQAKKAANENQRSN